MGQNLVFMPECHSTNTEALLLFKNQIGLEGTVVITDYQIAGRGQRSNIWESEPGKNLTFSIVLTPQFLLPRNQFYLTASVSVALAQYLSAVLNAHAKIKWPNDIIVQDKKLCGILIENQVSGQKIQSCIVGIGLNVNQETFSVPKAGSMRTISAHEFVLADVLESILEKIESNYLLLRQEKYKKLFSTYLDHLYWLGEKHLFSDGQQEFEGTITGVDEIGRLCITSGNGMRTFEIKELSFIK
jgi:BirA family biotin operon repressor/biotin-[acetyl-CoA-carboxylase] ligase